eukprot:g29842.t1
MDYFLGWFAAIAIEADDVTLDLAGYTISQSFIHSLFQRFFCIVELCARPFVAGQGPPAFTALKSQPICANRLTIQNGVMGPTSHHCVHGLRNSVVKMSNIDCREFEVAGFQLNGPRDVELSNLKIGPSSQATMAKATLSHTNFLLLFAQKFLPLIQLSSLGNVNPRQMQVKLRGSMHSVGDVFDRLKQARDKYIADLVANQPSPAQTCDYDPSQIFCNPSGLPDGSALVGILVHKDNVAINSFGACSVQEDHIYAEGKGNFSDLRILKVQIADMKLKTEEILEVHNNLGKKIIGPQGDVLNLFGDFGGDSRKFFFSRALKDRFKYRGNVLLDAQVALGKVASSWTGTAADRARWFGGLFISPEIFAYADGILEVSDSKHKVDCNLDAMGHVNKGAMGVRLEFIDNIFMKDVTVDRIRNEGLQGNYGVCDELPNWTPLKPYSGADARAMSFRYVQDGHYKKVQVNDITSQSGFACGWDMGLFTSLGAADDVEIYRKHRQLCNDVTGLERRLSNSSRSASTCISMWDELTWRLHWPSPNHLTTVSNDSMSLLPSPGGRVQWAPGTVRRTWPGQSEISF